MAFSIYLSPPNMCGNEREMVKEAFDTNWIAPYGPHLGKFEAEMANYVGVEAGFALLRDCGFRYVTTYRKHLPEMIKL